MEIIIIIIIIIIIQTYLHLAIYKIKIILLKRKGETIRKDLLVIKQVVLSI